MSKGCSCRRCIAACRQRPGWPMPSQVKMLMQHFRVSEPLELVKHGFAVDYWCGEGDESNVYVLAPNLKSNEGNPRYPFWPTGTCVFLDANERCSIHEVKPFECGEVMCCDERTTTTPAMRARKKRIVRAWKRSVMQPVLRDFYMEDGSSLDTLSMLADVLNYFAGDEK